MALERRAQVIQSVHIEATLVHVFRADKLQFTISNKPISKGQQLFLCMYDPARQMIDRVVLSAEGLDRRDCIPNLKEYQSNPNGFETIGLSATKRLFYRNVQESS